MKFIIKIHSIDINLLLSIYLYRHYIIVNLLFVGIEACRLYLHILLIIKVKDHTFFPDYEKTFEEERKAQKTEEKADIQSNFWQTNK